ncbi:hypothetical protein STH22820_12130 [Edwardsiella ictaluri]|nr:hypothetical protein STH22820_12130 [Edwardsiella ictaluri]
MNAVITDGGGDMPGADMQWHCEIFPLIQWINTACSDGLMSFTGAFKKKGGTSEFIVREGSFLVFRLYADIFRRNRPVSGCFFLDVIVR